MNRLTAILLAVIIALLVGMWYTTSRIKTLSENLTEATRVVSQQKADLENIQRQRVQAAELDTKVAEELSGAKSDNERLRADLDRGTKRLRIAASCPKLPETTATASNSDATSARLNNAAQRDYLTLRERIKTATTMINGLQSYIKTQCQ